MKDLYDSRKDGWYYYTWGINFRYVTFDFIDNPAYLLLVLARTLPTSLVSSLTSSDSLEPVNFSHLYRHYQVLSNPAKREEPSLWPQPVSTKCPSSPASVSPPSSTTSSTDSILSPEPPPNSKRSTFLIMLLSVVTTFR